MGKIESSLIPHYHFSSHCTEFQISYMATDIMFPEWKIWTQFLRQTADGLRMDALEQSHPIEVMK